MGSFAVEARSQDVLGGTPLPLFSCGNSFKIGKFHT